MALKHIGSQTGKTRETRPLEKTKTRGKKRKEKKRKENRIE